MGSKAKWKSLGLFTKILTIIGAVTLCFVLLIVISAIIAGLYQNRIPENVLLEIDFNKPLVETKNETIFDEFTDEEVLSIRNVVSTLDYASKDKRVKGVIGYFSDNQFSYADVQEIRDAVIRFKKSGKPIVAFAESFGEAGPGNSSYYLASSFDFISLQPSGNFSVTGIMAEYPFLRGTFDKLGIKPQLGSREEYKTYKNMFTERKFTDAHREVTRSIVDSIQIQFNRDIAKDRKLSLETVKTLVSQGPLSPNKAFAEKLVDSLEYRDQVLSRLKKKAGEGSELLYLTKYSERIRQPISKEKSIALIYGNGTIISGSSEYNPFSEDAVMGAKTIASAFRDAVRDKNIGAIVFRINSPGGSYLGSDIIWREMLLARKANKPIVVTMGSVAGSGGYFVALNANKIVAHPSTITGSIGVVSGKFAAEGLFNKLGISFDRISTSDNATAWSSVTEYTPEQWKKLDTSLDTIYNDFVSKVAQGRNISKEKAFQVAKGRVYTGIEALQLGLIDTLGGYNEAFGIAKTLMGVSKDKAVPVKRFPKQYTFWEWLFAIKPDNSEQSNESIKLMSAEQKKLTKIMFRYLGQVFTTGTLTMDKITIH